MQGGAADGCTLVCSRVLLVNDSCDAATLQAVVDLGAEGGLPTLHQADLAARIPARGQAQAAVNQLASHLLASGTPREDEGAGGLQDVGGGVKHHAGTQVVAGGAGVGGGDGGQDLHSRSSPAGWEQASTQKARRAADMQSRQQQERASEHLQDRDRALTCWCAGDSQAGRQPTDSMAQAS